MCLADNTSPEPHVLSLPIFVPVMYDSGWWRGTVVERRSLAGELSLSCARPAADG